MKNMNNEKYESLKLASKLISLSSYIVIAIGLFVAITLVWQTDFLLGTICILGSLIISLLLFSFSRLIFVFIEIAENTRNAA